MIGLYKAVRDFRHDKETSFRSFAELCVTRQIITAIKTATRFKHAPLNTYVSFSHTPAGQENDGECTLGDALPGPNTNDPSSCVISTEELQSLVGCLGTTPLFARVGGAAPLSRRQVVRRHGPRARLRHEDDRQRAPAREAQDRRAPGLARRAGLKAPASPGLPRPTLCSSASSRGRRARGARRPRVAINAVT